MGSYLEAPKTEKITSVVVTTKRLRYVTSSMQGIAKKKMSFSN